MVEKNDKELLKKIERKEKQKIRAKREKKWSSWMGLSVFGIIGWSVMIPTLIGLGIGFWIDSNYTTPFSWTLMLFIGGLIGGCFMAWGWIRSERRYIEKKRDDDE